MSFLLVSATLGAYLTHHCLLGDELLLKVKNSLKMSSLAPREMETRQSCVISTSEGHSGRIFDSSLFVRM